MDFLSALQQWQHALGAVIGFLALAAAAMFNAHLNRRRDDRLRRVERDLLALSLRAEVKGIVTQLHGVHRFNEAVQVKTPLDAARKLKALTMPAETVYPRVVMKIGLLAPEAAEIVTQFYGMLAHLRHSLHVRMPDLEPMRGAEGWFTIQGGESVEMALYRADQVLPKLIGIGGLAIQRLDSSIRKCP